MKRNRFSIVLLSLLIVGLLCSAFPISVRAEANDLDFDFESSIYYDSSSPLINRTFNVRNQTTYTNNYSGTYSFADEIDGTTDASIDFIDNDLGIGTATIQSEVEGHSKTMNMVGGVGWAGWDNDISRTFGTIELWVWVNQSNAECFVSVSDSGWSLQSSIYLSFAETGDLRSYNGVSYSVIEVGYTINVWHHLRIDFEFGVGGYLGLAQDTFNVVYDGKETNDLPIREDGGELTTANNFGFYTNIDGSGFVVDAIDYSWDANSSINDNIVPYITTNESSEVDRYEFALKGIDDWVADSSYDPNGWDTYTSGSGTSRVIKVVDEDRRIYTVATGAGGHGGIRKLDFAIHGERFNISAGFRFTERTDALGYTDFEIFSYDNTAIVYLRMDDTGELDYYYGASYHTLYSGQMSAYVDHEFDIYIDYAIDVAVIRHYKDGVFYMRSVIPLINAGKEGINQIDFDSTSNTAGSIIVYIEYLGIYLNGISKAEEYGYIAYDLEQAYGWAGDWMFTEHNLFRNIANGTFTIGVSAGNGYFEDYFYTTLIGEVQYNDTEVLYNVYDVYQDSDSYSQPFIIIYLQNDNVFNNLSLFNIEGVKLTEGVNEYPLIYEHGAINTNKSYFYVDSSNRLQYNLFVDDNLTEYIQASFNINDVSSENRSVNFKTNINGVGEGYFSVDYYSGGSSLMEFPYYQTTTNVILPQTELITKFTILITDNDLYYNGLCAGYVSNIKLIYNPDLSITITTLNLLGIIVPLIVMIAPPLALNKKFGSSVILPMFLLMSLVCVLTGLIPVWLFFIIAFSSIGFLMLKKKVEVAF